MANLKKVQQRRKIRPYRYFSEEFRRSKVEEIESNLSTVCEISRTYQVSRAAVYQWIYRYSLNLKRGTRQVIEMESDTRRIEALQKQVQELERIIGQKQLQIDFQEKLIELASGELGLDIKKKFGSQPCAGSGRTANDTSGQ